MGRKIFWVGVPPPLRRRPPPSRHVPWLTRLRVGTCGGVAPSTARPAPGASPSWAGSRRRRGLDHGGLTDSEGSPGPAPGCGPPGGLSQGRAGHCGWGWTSGGKTRSEYDAQANADSISRVFSGALKGRTSGVGPYATLTRLPSCPTPVECMPARGPPAFCRPGRTLETLVWSVPQAGLPAGVSQPGHGPGHSDVLK